MNAPQAAEKLLSPALAPPRHDPELVKRIDGHVLDQKGASFSFSQRLALENGWEDDYAARVIKEYRRFVYLSCIAGEELTPSDEVDQVWHLHLAYSRLYWDEFCPNVLRRPFHHGPTAGGSAEDARYEANYQRTLALYPLVFSEKPPLDIWPPPDLRFGMQHFSRVNRGLFTVLPRNTKVGVRPYPKPRWNWLIWGLVFVAVLVLVVQGQQDGGSFLRDAVVAALFTALIYIVSKVLRFALGGFGWDVSPPPEVKFSQSQHGYDVNYVIAGGTTFLSSLEAGPRRREMERRCSGGGCTAGGCATSSGGAGCSSSSSSGCGGSGCGGGGD